MRPDEISALGAVTGDAVRGVTLQVHDVHAGIARRVFSAVGPLALPVRLAHDSITRGAYRAAGELGRVIVRGGAGAMALAAGVAPGSLGAGSLEDSAGGRAMVGALNGACGDTLRRQGNRLALPMALRLGGRDVEVSAQGLLRAYPRAGSRLVVFVHGLGQTEDAWSRRGTRHVPYGFRLSVEVGYTPLYVRYNSGRHISENGRELAALLDLLVAAWPVAVSEIALVGHATGGLVARSACHYGSGCAWTRSVRQVISLGSPHRGTPLERLTTAAGAVLARAPETRPVARALEVRSAGIKDLAHGYLVDEDWEDAIGDAREIPFLSTARHYFVSAGAPAPVGRASAWALPGARRPMRFPADHYREIAGVGHFDLLNHPAVYSVIGEWLGRARPALPAPRPALPPG